MQDSLSDGSLAGDSSGFPSDRESRFTWILDRKEIVDRLAGRAQRRMGLAPDLAEEITNETVVEIVMSDTGPTSGESGWLKSKVLTAANRVAKNNGKARRGRNRNRNNFSTPVAITKATVVVDKAAKAAVERVEAHDLLDSLPQLVAQVLWMHLALGLSQMTIADTWRWSQQKVSRFYLRALKSAQRACGL